IEPVNGYELAERGLTVERQKALPVKYRGVKADCGFGSKNSHSAFSAFSAVNRYRIGERIVNE
ncbi:MAG: hypothetical protein KAU38_00760, partial [Desulfobacterales bacterium]|nr:hypothetical protein [Desulfobacterales bacterium]